MLLAVITLAFLHLFFGAEENALPKASNEDLLVEISTGKVRGSIMQSEGGRDFYAYRGIPYGEAPIGPLRFKDPLPKKKWEGVFDASKDGKHCIQFSVQFQKLLGVEDCLLVNVYVPPKASQRTNSKLLPVIVFIHGGAFVMGSGLSTEVGPEKMMDYDVVIVTFNFRLNAMGFLSTKDKASPGNYGLLDQVLLLKWVRDNIEAFGGNPNKVTLTGTSAGGWAVMLHMVSPLSKGLFHAAISQSGTPFGNWGNVFNPKETLSTLAPMLKCNAKNNQDTINCIRSRSAVDIVENSFYIEDFCELISHVRYHGEKDDARGEQAFLPDYAPLLLDEGSTINKVPLFIGVTSDDASFIFDACSPKYALGNEHLNKWLPTMLQKILEANDEKSKTLRQGIINEYMPDLPKDDNEVSRRIVRAYSDMTFDYSVDDISRKMSKLGIPVYVYRFTHSKGPSDLLGLNLTFEYKRPDHVSHGEDLPYLFNIFEAPSNKEWFNFSENDKKVSRLLLDLWTSFATHQVPSSNLMTFPWRLSTASQPAYLNISVEPSMVEGELSLHTDFWIRNIKKLDAQYY